jgi:hypothetical protein
MLCTAPSAIFTLAVIVMLTCLDMSSCRTGLSPAFAGRNSGPPAEASGYRLVFADDFSASSVSPNGTGKFNWYEGLWWEPPAPASNFLIANGVATLAWSRTQKPDDTSLTSLSRDGRNYHAWRYGYFEIRMKWDPVQGSWPAIWMLPVQNIRDATTQSGELDIFEGQGATKRVFYGTIHEWKQHQDIRNNKGSNIYHLPPHVDLSQFHIYGALWTPGKVTWYFDDQRLFSASTYAVFDQQDYYLILSSQEGANWKYGDLSGVAASRMTMTVDWVHVWQK